MSINDSNSVNHVNQLLAALPRSQYQRLLPHLHSVQLTEREIIYQSQETIRYAYFPEQGLISLVTILENGATIEVGRVGKEGIVGLSAILGANSSMYSAMVLIAGSTMKLEVEILKQEFHRGEELQRLLLLYIQARLNQVMQNTACYSQHLIEQRFARLLLSLHDCLQQKQFALTQELIATTLGVRRASVNNAAINLQKAKIIDYSRGNITIINRSGLERSACECYSTIKTEFQKLFSFNVK
ncbi:MAG: Crp/Fnr family transcriptional regulator [Pleurocapsa sp. MO_192.B19]|nr:Crp/Fnr family transcriptional regulator [Pleurocapsa sp. MO_192.B19]